MQGKIIRLISNQYQVLLDDGRVVDAMARGKLRLGVTPLAGDTVEVEQFEEKWGIEKIYDRKNFLKRPPIANVDQAFIVMSCREPNFSTLLVDQLIFLISYAGIEPVLLITKMDLAQEGDKIYEHIEDYRKSGYKVLLCHKDASAEDLKEISEALRGKVTVLSGQSGVGKSSFLNKLAPDFHIRTQEISKSLGRGKHTTRHVELHKVADGYVADTPGFSKLDLTIMEKAELAACLKDFEGYHGHCRFRDCLHDKEPDCAVKSAVREGKISSVRYQHYLEALKAIEEGRKELYD